jgi:probable phosphoglycerate mutase
MDTSSAEYCTLYIVRHGETEGNKKQIVMGHHDAPLTTEGEQQIRDTAQKLKDVHFDAIFSSDLPRAQRTAEIIRLDRQLAIQTSALLRERNFGPFEGKPSAEYREMIKDLLVKKSALSEKEQWTFGFGEGVETDEALVTRFIAQVREIAAAYPGKTVLVASHGGCIRTFLVRTGWTNYAGMPSGSFRNGGYVQALSDGVDFIIKDVQGVHVETGSE